ncbi:MAG TPA: hypothetical protein VLD84_01620 [Nitrososphaeraceae archaeon]|nr:hypothetical protein [Nitrososphaeraceae archaeon]
MKGNGFITIKPNITISVIERPPFGENSKIFGPHTDRLFRCLEQALQAAFPHIMDRIKQRGKGERT